jgi:hypothetical protein
VSGCSAKNREYPEEKSYPKDIVLFEVFHHEDVLSSEGRIPFIIII